VGVGSPHSPGFDLYVNLRPVRRIPGVTCPLRNKGPADIDMMCVRENTEGEYSGVGGRVHRGHPAEVAIQPMSSPSPGSSASSDMCSSR
jgi:tartrate dehydrogenase/decarboxylase/D-malate dehydrogenase